MNIEKITQGKNLTDTERTVLEYILDHHRPLNTAARKFQQMLTKADPPRPAASKQTESISFVSQ